MKVDYWCRFSAGNGLRRARHLWAAEAGEAGEAVEAAARCNAM